MWNNNGSVNVKKKWHPLVCRDRELNFIIGKRKYKVLGSIRSCTIQQQALMAWWVMSHNSAISLIQMPYFCVLGPLSTMRGNMKKYSFLRFVFLVFFFWLQLKNASVSLNGPLVGFMYTHMRQEGKSRGGENVYRFNRAHKVRSAVRVWVCSQTFMV